MQLIECVPNISDGRNVQIIEQIVQSFTNIDDVYLLHKDIGYDVNRTVLTIAGTPCAVYKAAFRIIKTTSELVDMQKHRGSHPRIGATDVCPIIPLLNTTMSECIELSKKLAHKVGMELKIPVYLYAESANLPERKSLAYIRDGEYENLFLRLNKLVFKPDFGPTIFNAKSGAIAIGARSILIAYNIHLNTEDLQIAKDIARLIRQHREYYKNCAVSGNEISKSVESAINWQDVQAVGWYVPEYKCCQISLNLLNYKKTSLHKVFLGVTELARQYGIDVLGSEIIGLSPLSPLLAAGSFAHKLKNESNTFLPSEEHLLIEAINFLKLDLFSPFKKEEKVLEYSLRNFGLSLPPRLE